MTELQASAPLIIVKACANDDEEYSQALATGTKHFELQARTSFPIRLAFATGDVASGTDYITIKADDAYSSFALWGGTDITLYFAHTAGESVSVEIVCWR